MSPIDILGSLLGGKSGGGDILGDLLGGRQTRDSRPAPRPSQTQTTGRSPSINDLEDMLEVGSNSRPAPKAPSPSPASPPPRTTTTPGTQSRPSNPTGFPDDIFGRTRRGGTATFAASRPAELPDSDKAMILIRAMINVAKVDGEISEQEQQFILDRVGDTSQQTIQFLRNEFARPLDVVEFARSVPVGMEERVYQISLMAIKLDQESEADYLRQLAQELRITPEEVIAVHQQMQVPAIYS